MELTPEQKKILNDIIKEEKPELIPLLDVLENIESALKAIAEKETPKMEMPDTHKVEIQGAEVVTLQGKPGEKGEGGEQGEQGLPGKDGQDGKNGLNGKDGLDGKNGLDGKDGVDGKDGENGKDGSPDTPTQIVEKLETLEGDTRLDKKAIKGLEEMEKDLETVKARPVVAGGGRTLRAAPFSFTGDATTTQFYLPTEPAGKGWFLFAHYQGQWIQKDVHYTIKGKLFDTQGGTLPFTAENSTVIEGFIIY
jgi:hypothetical protein